MISNNKKLSSLICCFTYTFYTFCPQATGEGINPARSVFVLDDENIIISSGSQIAYLEMGFK